MGKRKIISRAGSLVLSNKLGKFERINHEEVKILVNGSVPGLALVQVTPKRRSLLLTVDATGWTPIRYYFAGRPSGDTLFGLIWSAVNIACGCERYGLRLDQLCWNPDWMFVDPAGKVRMIYWPVTTLDRQNGDPLEFFYTFYAYLLQSDVDPETSQQYGQYFYQRNHFDLHRFQHLMAELVEQRYRQRVGRRAASSTDQKEQAAQQVPQERRFPSTGVWLENRKRDERISLSLHQNRIGRDPSQNEVHLKGYCGVSRRHAVISRGEDKVFYVTDLGSANGTFVEGQRVAAYQQVPLRDGCRVRFGDAAFIFFQKDTTQTILVH